MSDLISREALLEAIRNNGYSDNPDAMFEEIMEVIEEQPTAYDAEKVVAELEQQSEQYRKRGFEHERKDFAKMADKYYGKQCSYLHAIDIVKRGGVE